MIYYFDEITKISSKYYKIYNILPDFRKQKICKYRFFNDKLQSALAYCLLLFAADSMNTSFDFKIDKYGKPYDSCKNIHFNLSHCANSVACIVGNNPVGIDVEKIIDKDCYISIVSKVCNEKEIELIKKSENILREFTKIWTLKESYTKMVGSGIIVNLQKICFFNFNCYFGTMEFENYILSYCSYRHEDLIHISFNELMDFIDKHY